MRRTSQRLQKQREQAATESLSTPVSTKNASLKPLNSSKKSKVVEFEPSPSPEPPFAYKVIDDIPVSEVEPDYSRLEKPLSIGESRSLDYSLLRSRNSWLSGKMFEKFWTRPPRGRKLAQGEVNAREKMSKFCECSMVMGPHMYQVKFFLVKDDPGEDDDEDADDDEDEDGGGSQQTNTAVSNTNNQENLSHVSDSQTGALDGNQSSINESSKVYTDPSLSGNKEQPTLDKRSDNIQKDIPSTSSVNEKKDEIKEIQSHGTNSCEHETDQSFNNPSHKVPQSPKVLNDVHNNSESRSATPQSISSINQTSTSIKGSLIESPPLQNFDVMDNPSTNSMPKVSTITENSTKMQRSMTQNTDSSTTQSSTTQSSTTQSSTTQSSTTQSSTTQSSTTQSSTTQSSTTQSSTIQSSTTQSSTIQRSTTQSSTQNSALQNPTTQSLTTQVPATQQPPSNPSREHLSAPINQLIISRLQAMAKVDPYLSALMRIVATGKGTNDQISTFQLYISRARNMDEEKFRQMISSSSHNYNKPWSTNMVMPVKSVPKALRAPKAPKTPKAPKAPKVPKAPKAPKVPKSSKRPAVYAPRKPLKNIKIVFEFKDNPIDRFVLPKNSVMEILANGEILVSFLYTQKIIEEKKDVKPRKKDRKGKNKRSHDLSNDTELKSPDRFYFTPITIEIRDVPHRLLPILQKCVYKQQRVVKRMMDIMQTGIRSKTHLVWYHIEEEDTSLQDIFRTPPKTLTGLEVVPKRKYKPRQPKLDENGNPIKKPRKSKLCEELANTSGTPLSSQNTVNGRPTNPETSTGDSITNDEENKKNSDKEEKTIDENSNDIKLDREHETENGIEDDGKDSENNDAITDKKDYSNNGKDGSVGGTKNTPLINTLEEKSNSNDSVFTVAENNQLSLEKFDKPIEKSLNCNSPERTTSSEPLPMDIDK